MEAAVPVKLGMAMNREQNWLKTCTKAIRPPPVTAQPGNSPSLTPAAEDWRFTLRRV